MSTRSERARLRLAALAGCTALVTGCAQIPEGAGSDPSDPWERINRHTFEFNQQMDTYVARPVAKAYEKVVPQGVREGVTNALGNLGEPANVVNNALQGKGEGALVSLFRFMINSTIGLGGIFDVAGTYGNQPVRKEDFGQTLAVWGVPSGPYLVLPFMPPSTVRDATGLGVQYFMEPPTWMDETASWAIWGAYVVDLRYQMLPATDLVKDAVDPYLMTRQAYLATRQKAIYDGDVPFEFTKDEFEDEDETTEEKKDVK